MTFIQYLKIPKKELLDLYSNKRLRTTEIAKLFGCNRRTIYRYLKEYNINRHGTSIALKGNVPIHKNKTYEEMYGINKANELKCLVRKNFITLRKDGKLGNKDTSIERLVENQLLFNNILYIKQFAYEFGVADFWLPEYNIIIECDGDYWHSLPNRKERDIRNTKYLESNDFVVFRFTETQIKESPETCLRMCGLI